MLIALIGLIGMGWLNVGTAFPPMESKVTQSGPSPDWIASARMAQERGLRFPFASADNMLQLYSFGLYPWSPEGEVHGGMDLVPYYADLAGTNQFRKEAIVAPIDGMVYDIIQGTTGHDVPSFIVLLQVDFYWYVILNFEPQTDNADILSEQQNSIVVEPGQVLKQGDLVGHLVVSGHIVNSAYPHIHYGLFFKNPGDSFGYVIKNAETLPRDDGTTLPLRWQSLLKGQKFTIPTTFFCPYEYSSSSANIIMEGIPVKTLGDDDQCDCICAYDYADGVCQPCDRKMP